MRFLEGRIRREEIVSIDEIDYEVASELIKFARYSIEYYLEHEDTPPKPQDLANKYPIIEKRGAVFITLEKLVGSRRELRGCIGFVIPYLPLWRAVSESAISSAFKDPRFNPVERDELDHIIIELSILSISERVKDPLKEVVIGRDGLYIVKGLFSGVLLPQVPIDYCWDVETFLGETCIKAGLDPTCWLENDTEIYRIPGKIFSEKSPGGEIFYRDIEREYREKCKRSSS